MKNLIFSVIILTALMSCQRENNAKDISGKALREVKPSYGNEARKDSILKGTFDAMTFAEYDEFPSEEVGYLLDRIKVGLTTKEKTTQFAMETWKIKELKEGEGYQYRLIGNKYDLLIADHGFGLEAKKQIRITLWKSQPWKQYWLFINVFVGGSYAPF